MARQPGADATLLVVGATTRTAGIEGISAAGADPGAMAHTPSADLEVVTYGRPVRAPVVPVSPTGCPTPAVVTRAVRELVGLETVAVDAGLAEPTAAPTVALGEEPGEDVRESVAVPDAAGLVERAHDLGRRLPGPFVVGETVPGGTTTALGVLTALGESATVSSSLSENPLARKRAVVETALAASDLAAGDLAGEPVEAVRRMGDPVLAATLGLLRGADEAGTDVTLAGGTQLAAAAALYRHGGGDVPLELATTSFVADDGSADLWGLARDLDLSVTATDPGFDRRDHPATDAYARGEAKEGVGMGGALALADAAGVPMADVRERTVALADRLLAFDPPTP
jgi:uncharacterized protein (TIGR00303 family)